MTRKLMPWRRDRTETAVTRHEDNPFLDLHRRMNEVFADFFAEGGEDPFWPRGLPRLRDLPSAPKVDVAETDTAVVVTADLPGLDEKNVEVTLDDRLLTIRDRREEEKNETKRSYHLIERSYGEVQRAIQLPAGIDRDQVKAAFKNGVLTVTLPKTPEAKATSRRIEVTG